MGRMGDFSGKGNLALQTSMELCMGLRAYAVKAQVRMGRPWLSRRVVQILILLLCMTGRNARRFFWERAAQSSLAAI